MKPEIIGYIVEQYFSLLEPRPYLAVQFAKNIDGLRALSVLSGMASRFGAKLLKKDEVQVIAILSSRAWGPGSQIIHTQFSSKTAFEDWLRGSWRGFEQINLLPGDNPLNPFLTKPTKRADLAEEIIRQTLPPELKKYLAEYGFTVEGQLESYYGLPEFVFMIKNGSHVKTLELCCWGGVISVASKPKEKYLGPSRFQEIIKETMDELLDEMTA